MIDWAQIKQLEEDIGAEDFGDVVSLFIEEVDEAIRQLQDDPPNSADMLGPALHFLKGSAYNLGFKAFGDYCSDGEKLAMDGASGDVDLEQVVELYSISKDMFLSQAVHHCSFVPD